MTPTFDTQRPGGHRAVPLLHEPDVGHYPEFAEFFSTRFGLAEDPFGAAPVATIDGRHYELIFTGRSGRSFPEGLEIHALVEGLEPLDREQADADLMVLVAWLVDSVGAPWSAEALEHTAKVFKLPAAVALDQIDRTRKNK